MKLDSARALKSQLRGELEALTGDPTSLRTGHSVPIAYGVSPGKGTNDYRLAVRTETPLSADVQEKLTEAAHGEIDVRTTGTIAVVSPVAAVRPTWPLQSGCSIGHYSCSAGTVGFIARRISDGAIGIVSNNHVLAAEDAGIDGDEVLSPGPADRGRRPQDVVARLDGRYPRLQKNLDCAFAPLLRHIQYDSRALGRGEYLRPTPVPPSESQDVVKIGRTTLRTEGRVSAFELDEIAVHYATRTIFLSEQIEIDTVCDEPFCRPGDSGSLVFAPGGSPVGLLCATSVAGGTHGYGLAYAQTITSVLKVLGVAFVT